MAFSGWTDEALDFYEGLIVENTKAYWTAHKAVYDDKVLRPMTELTEELAAKFADFGESGEPKLFRPYRDVRFSPDKTPYKTHIGATIGHMLYIQFSADGLGVGAGMWHMGPEELARYRSAVAADHTGGELSSIVTDCEKNGATIHGHDVLKSAPRGYPADHPRIGLLRYKGVTAWQDWPPEPWLATGAAKDRVVSFFMNTRQLREWLAHNVARLAAFHPGIRRHTLTTRC